MTTVLDRPSSRLPTALAGVVAGAVVVVLAFTVPISHAETRDTSSPVEIRIEVQPLGRALVELARETGLRVLASERVVAGKMAPGLAGEYEPEVALTLLLEGSGLIADRSSNGSWIIRSTHDDGASGRDGAPRAPASNPTASNEAEATDPAEPLAVRRGVEDSIVVVGERIDRSLVDAVSSVTVVDREAVEREAGRHVNQTLRRAPNVLIEAISEIPTIRGIEGGGPGGVASGGSAGTLPRLSIILDGVPLVANVPNASFSDLYDVRQVEIARGPQTTLFGRNALAGAILVETNDPTFEPEAELQSTSRFDSFSGFDYSVSGLVSGPIVEDKWAGRLVVQTMGGEDPREVIGAPPGVDSSFLIEHDAMRARGKLLGGFETRFGALRLEALVDYQEGTTPQTRNTVTGPGPTGTGRPFEDRAILFAGPNRIFDNEAIVTAVEAELTLSDGLSIESSTSLARVDYVSIEEQLFPSNFDSSERFLSQDLILRFGQNGARFSGLVGVALEDREQEIGIVGIPLNSAAETESTQLSAFTDLRFDWKPNVELIFGGRVLDIDQDRIQTIATLIPTPGGVITIPGVTTLDDRETVFLPSVGAVWRFTEGQSLRATYKEGFNAGGSSLNFFTGQPFVFDSERLQSLEIGWRGAFSDDRLILSATGFHNDFDDQQFFLETIPGDRFSIIVANVPKSSSFGLELEAIAQPREAVELSFGLGLLQTEIDEGPASNPNFNGNDFGRDPSLTFHAGAVWRATPRLSLDGQLNYTSEYFPTFANVPGAEVGDFVLLDLGATLSHGRFALRCFVRNVTDELALTSRVNDFGVLAQPRTVGFALTTKLF